MEICAAQGGYRGQGMMEDMVRGGLTGGIGTRGWRFRRGRGREKARDCLFGK